MSDLFTIRRTLWPYDERVISSWLCAQQVGLIVKKHDMKVSNPFNMQSEFAVLNGAIHDLTNVNEDFYCRISKSDTPEYSTV